MQAYSPTKRIWKRMLEYGAIWGTIFGGAVATVLLLVSLDYGQFPGVMFVIVSLLFVACIGCFFGAFFGMIVGLLSGLAMSWITAGYGYPDNVIEYRMAMGMSATVITILVFLPLLFLAPAIDWFILRNNYLFGIIGSMGMVIYASQRVATKYLHDIGYDA